MFHNNTSNNYFFIIIVCFADLYIKSINNTNVLFITDFIFFVSDLYNIKALSIYRFCKEFEKRKEGLCMVQKIRVPLGLLIPMLS